MKVKLGDITKIRTGRQEANAASADGEYPLFTCSRESLRISSYSYECECVLVAGNGDLNVKYYNGKFDAYQRTYIIESKQSNILYMPYLYYFMEKYIVELRQLAIGGVIKYIKLGNLTEALIELPSYAEQQALVERLSKVKSVIDRRNEQIKKLDELVKCRFVEMFGDTELNPYSFPVEKLGNLCCVGSSKRIYQNEQSTEGIPFLRISDLVARIDQGIESCKIYIPFEKYKELSGCNLVPGAGDILITSRGTLGKCYIVKETDKFYFQDGMISWLSEISEKLTSQYISHLFSMRSMHKQMKNLQAGSTVAYLSIAMLKKLDIMLPPLELQYAFSDCVQRVGTLRSAIQRSMEETQKLFDSLMQKYFD